MIDSLFDKKRAKKFDSIAKKKAKIHDLESKAAQEFMNDISSETIIKILDIVEKKGHPNEVESSKKLRNKYQGPLGLEFDDIKELQMLYQSNYQFFKDDNKEKQDE